ncbi:MAG: hypothetical protein NT033_04370, partial [Candidatus Omnitrophica bacterium]|nr:hypothetical protein [Candidatus Omnitrophota bacterium]
MMPLDKGFSLSAYNMYYTSDTFKGPGGSKLDSLSVSGTATKYINIQGKSIPVILTGDATAELSFNLNKFSQTFNLTWVPEVKLLGADYALVISPS